MVLGTPDAGVPPKRRETQPRGSARGGGGCFILRPVGELSLLLGAGCSGTWPPLRLPLFCLAFPPQFPRPPQALLVPFSCGRTVLVLDLICPGLTFTASASAHIPFGWQGPPRLVLTMEPRSGQQLFDPREGNSQAKSVISRNSL